MTADFHVLVFMRSPIAIEASLVAGIIDLSHDVDALEATGSSKKLAARATSIVRSISNIKRKYTLAT